MQVKARVRVEDAIHRLRIRHVKRDAVTEHRPRHTRPELTTEQRQRQMKRAALLDTVCDLVDRHAHKHLAGRRIDLRKNLTQPLNFADRATEHE